MSGRERKLRGAWRGSPDILVSNIMSVLLIHDYGQRQAMMLHCCIHL